MRRGRRAALVAVVGTIAVALGNGTALAGKPNNMESCKICHTAADGDVWGRLVSVSPEFKSLSVTVGPLVWVFKYGDDLKVKEGEKLSGPEALKTIPRDREITVSFGGGEANPVASLVAVKLPFKVPAEKLVSVEEAQNLVAQGSGKAAFFDSRPGAMFAEGHVPGALSLPFAAFKEKAASLLPADKGALVVFYCAGET